jgi:hypothetical protein
MAPGLRFLSKRRGSSDKSSDSRSKVDADKIKDVDHDAFHQAQTKETSVEESLPQSARKQSIEDFIQVAFGDEAIGNLVALANARDDLVKDATAGFFPDVITGCVDICMAIVLASLTFSESLDADARASEEVMRSRVRAYIMSVLDAVYGPNCVKITVYNPEVDWNVSLWQMFPITDDSPAARTFLSSVPSQSDAAIQWMDLKSRLVKECRNPKRDSQRTHKIAALEEELKELSLRHAALIERFIKIQQGEKDPEGAQAKREAEAKRLVERKYRLGKIINEKHRIVDPVVRTKRDAILWGGQPHNNAASLNTSLMTKRSTNSIGRRLSRFGFKSTSDVDEDSLDGDSSSSAPSNESPENHLPSGPEDVAADRASKGCFAIFRCCGTSQPQKNQRRPGRKPAT